MPYLLRLTSSVASAGICAASLFLLFGIELNVFFSIYNEVLNMAIQKVGIVGAGTMGSGIA